MSETTISDEQRRTEADVVDRVLASFDATRDPRLKQILQSLVRHLHGFLREVRLSEEEWRHAIEFLTATGHITDDRRQEFILLSDVLGASMQVIAVNNERRGDATEATVFGPFFVEDAPLVENGGDTTSGAAGEPCWVEGTVRRLDGTSVPGASIEVWQADEDGLYDVQYDDHRTAGRARLVSDENGDFRFWALTPTPYPIPNDGPVGVLLAAAQRSPMRASHLHFMVSAEGCRTLVTHIFVEGDKYLDRDSVFGVKESLVKRFERQESTTPTPDGRPVKGTWTRTRFDIVLADADQ